MADDLYKRLHVRRSASVAAIDKAYRRLARKHHPDRGGDRREFESIDFAYQILSDPEKRAKYDQNGEIDTSRISQKYERVAAVISGVLVHVVRQIIEQGGKVENEDLVGHMLKVIDEALRETKKQKAQLDKSLAALGAVLGRFSVEGEDNLLDGMVQFHQQQLQHQIRAIDDQIAQTTEAVGYLRKYKYRFEKMDRLFMPGSWRGGYTNAATSTGGFFGFTQ